MRCKKHKLNWRSVDSILLCGRSTAYSVMTITIEQHHAEKETTNRRYPRDSEKSVNAYLGNMQFRRAYFITTEQCASTRAIANQTVFSSLSALLHLACTCDGIPTKSVNVCARSCTKGWLIRRSTAGQNTLQKDQYACRSREPMTLLQYRADLQR